MSSSSAIYQNYPAQKGWIVFILPIFVKKLLFSWSIQKNVVPLQRETQRRDVCASAEGFADILKRRLLRSVLTL